MTDAATLLWTDAAWGASAARAVTRFVTVRDAVTRRDDLGAARDEFLMLADALDDSVWAEPKPYWWARTAERALDEGDLVAVLARFPGDVVDATVVDSTAPIARCGDYRVRLAAEPMAVPDWELVEPALTAGADYHAAHVGLVEDTLATLAGSVPDILDAFRRIIRVIGLKPRDAGGYDDFSNPELPGSFVASVRPEPTVLADHFVHELQHNKLSFVEELGALFDEGRPAGRCYSPWRDDRRSPYGVFHGVYVFLGVHEYWQHIDAQDLGGERGAYRARPGGTHPAATRAGRRRPRTPRTPHAVRCGDPRRARRRGRPGGGRCRGRRRRRSRMGRARGRRRLRPAVRAR